MFRIILAVIYMSIGTGVVAVEQDRNPQPTVTNGVYLWMVALWPAFPVSRIYRQIFPAAAE